MDNHLFNMQIRPLNIEYRKIFGEIPRITDYSCSRDEYIAAMKASLETRVPLETTLIRRMSQFVNDDHQEENGNK